MPSLLPILLVAFNPQAATKGPGVQGQEESSPLAGKKKAEIGWEQWGFGEICRKRLERGLKSSSLLKIGGREDALC